MKNEQQWIDIICDIEDQYTFQRLAIAYNKHKTRVWRANNGK